MRLEKINELLKQELSSHFALDFPNEIITINFIHTLSDLSLTKVFVSVMSERPLVYEGLKNNSPEYRKTLAHKLYLRKMPLIEIHKDKMRESIEHIEELLEKKR